MSKAAAWVMKVDESLYTSVSQMELVHIIDKPYFVNIPKAPEYCQNIVIWNENILPVVDLSCLLNDTKSRNICDFVAVIIYRDCNSEIHYGGVKLVDSPELEYVDNNQLCNIPEHSMNIQTISLSCFISKDGHETPILDMSKVFSIDCSKKYIKQQR